MGSVPMMGIHQRQSELWAKSVDLGCRIPEDHLLRKLDRVLDLGFVREEVADPYGRRGNISVDPVHPDADDAAPVSR